MRTLTVDERGTLSVQEIPKPTYGECQALVKMQSCGVCNGTDMKLIHHSFKNFDSYPAILGHEGVGRVVETGSKVTGLHVGDMVLLPFLEQKTCGYTPGWGAYSEYAVVGDAESYIANGMGEGTKGHCCRKEYGASQRDQDQRRLHVCDAELYASGEEG